MVDVSNGRMGSGHMVLGCVATTAGFASSGSGTTLGAEVLRVSSGEREGVTSLNVTLVFCFRGVGIPGVLRMDLAGDAYWFVLRLFEGDKEGPASAEILLLKVGACLGEPAFSLLPSSSSFGEPKITFLSARKAKTGAGVSGASSIVNSAIALTFARTDTTRT